MGPSATEDSAHVGLRGVTEARELAVAGAEAAKGLGGPGVEAGTGTTAVFEVGAASATGGSTTCSPRSASKTIVGSRRIGIRYVSIRFSQSVPNIIKLNSLKFPAVGTYDKK